jgi:PAS domain S-box-containing protein
MTKKIKNIFSFPVLIVGGILGYTAFFLCFHPIIGDSVAIFAFVPPVIVAWFRGLWRGLAAAILADIATLVLLSTIGVAVWNWASLFQRLPGLIAVVIIAVIVGYMSVLRERVRRQLEEKKKTEIALRESEARFKAIFEKSSDALMLLTEKGFFDCNPATLEMFGFKSIEEFSCVHPADISPPTQPDGTESFPAAMERIKTGFEQGSNRFEWVHRRTNGEDFFAEVLLTAFDMNGKRVLQATVRDISKRKLAERARAESEQNFRRMFEITSEGVALISPETGKFIAANPAMCAMFGYSEEEFCLLAPEDITPPEAKEIMRMAMKTLFDGGIVPDHEGISIKKDGTKVNVIVSNRSMSWKGQYVFHVTFKDVTFIKEIQEQLKKKNAEIREFTEMVVHDLKKPLTTMNIVLGMSMKGAFGPLTLDGADAVGTGMEASKYMQEMMEDLLACARLESGTQELVIEKTGFRELADEVLGRLEFQVEEKKISVTLPEGDISVMVDKKQLTRVLMNLVGNAINYIGRGPDKFIKIGWEQKNGAPVFTVADNGIGIPDKSKESLFGKFKRGSNVSGVQGTGLGLSIVKGIVEAHGGKIWFDSETGMGTTFYFTLAGEGAKS